MNSTAMFYCDTAVTFYGNVAEMPEMRDTILNWGIEYAVPNGPKITPRAFGKDWRLPITNKYRES